MKCRRCDAEVKDDLEHYSDTLGCWQCKRSERRILLDWFAKCDLSQYETSELAAAYKALTDP